MSEGRQHGYALCVSGDERYSRAKQKHKIECLMKGRDVFTEAEGLGPRDALKRVMLTVTSEAEKNAYMQGARLDAILGSCLASMPSVRSGVRCYLAFADAMAHWGTRKACICRLDWICC